MTAEGRTDPYDVVIVGAGISGSILAKELAEAGADVLVLEAGTDEARTFSGYQDQLERFRGAVFKTPESPYAYNPNAPQPDLPGIPTEGAKYFVEAGKQPYRSTYARTAGGTTLHWLGTCLRMLPEDFALRTNFGRGRDWPLGYGDLAKDYERAEGEIGVAGDAAEQTYLGVSFSPGYRYPMQPIPPSWLDRQIAGAVDGLTVRYGKVNRSLKVRGTPAGRNSTPNPGYQPIGAVDRAADWSDPEEGQDLARDIGERCQGSTSCTPICPVQAKYNALKTLTKATRTGRVRVVTQAVAARVLSEGRQVTGIEYLSYGSPSSSRHTVERARGRTYVLACHAVENAKLLLNSAAPDLSGLIGRCLYDHPTVLTWGLMPEPIGAFRGPLSTSGIEDLRGGEFRSKLAAFRLEIGNEGWLWPMGAPETTVESALNEQNLIGAGLRKSVGHLIARQFRVGMLVEMLPDPTNRISIDPAHTDPLGLPKPVVTYNDFDQYTLAGIAAASNVAETIFAALGAEDHTTTKGTMVGTATYREREYPWDGAGHYAGTHLMGDAAADSVVDPQQRFWGYDNLHVAGPGSMPTMGTSNPTLTVAALAFRTARSIIDALELCDGRHA
jgi:choline dehydrogenase-like flavoprotein